MIRLSVEKEDLIRDRLDYIAHNLHQNTLLFEDGCWMHKTIKDLLYDIYELQRGMKDDGAT